MMREIEFAKVIKKTVERIPCFECGKSFLTFTSVDIDEEFAYQEGESALANTYCRKCETKLNVVIEVS